MKKVGILVVLVVIGVVLGFLLLTPNRVPKPVVTGTPSTSLGPLTKNTAAEPERVTPPAAATSPTAEKSQLAAAVAAKLTNGNANSMAKLDKMSAREMLKLATQLSKEDQLYAAAAKLAPHLSRNWRDSLSFDEIAAIIADSSTAAQLRPFLIDFLIHEADLTADENTRLSAILLTLAESNDTEAELRRYALLTLRYGTTREQTTRIREISENVAAPQEVRGAAITALRRTCDNDALDAVVGKVLDNAATAAPDVLRHAVVSAAKAGIASERVGKLRDIVMMTDSAEVYASTIYALGLVGTHAAVAAIVDSAGRYENDHIVRYALKQCQPAIIQMLTVDQPTDIVEAGIQAARRGGIAAAAQSLSLLRDTHPDTAIRQKAKDTLVALPSVSDVDSKIPRKWED